MQFSVLIPVYEKENPDFFDQSLGSIWNEQTLRPSEIVIVEDGRLTQELNQVILSWKEKLGDKLQIISLNKNVGLGIALQKGLLRCHFELVARMDSDDISDNSRFEEQVERFKLDPELDVLGTHVTEFHTNNRRENHLKKVPINHQSIVRYSKFRNPFNHPTVMFRKSAVLKAGGYQPHVGMEDYLLWVRMIMTGAKVANINKSLVNMRVSGDFITRRGGLNYARQEIRLQRTLLALKHISVLRFLLNITLRLPIRMAPLKFRSFLYKKTREL